MRSYRAYTMQRNLKGKKYKVLPCRCCVIENRCSKILKRIQEKEMQEDLLDVGPKNN